MIHSTQSDVDFQDTGDFKASNDTYPKLLKHNYLNHTREIAMRHKKYGIWNEYSWADCFHNIRSIGLGLVSLGLRPGDKVCIIGNSEPQWYWAELAVQSVGAISVGLYTDSIAEEMKYIAQHCEATFAFARDQEQVDKSLEVRESLQMIRRVIFWEPKGMWKYSGHEWIMNIDDLIRMGEEYNISNPDFFEQSISKSSHNDICVFSYTSGTTGLPKGAMTGYDMTLYAAGKFRATLGLGPGDEYVSFLPPAWVAEQLFGIAPWLALRITVNFPESADTIWSDIREIGASYALLGPAQCNSFLKQVQVRVNDAHPAKRLVYSICLRIGYQVQDRLQNGSLNYLWRLLGKIADWSCAMHVRDYLGLRFVKIAFTGGSILGPDTFRWYRAIGINLSEIYGLSEATPLTMHGKEVKVGTIGRCFPGVEARLTESGELQFKYPYPFVGYYKNEKATEEALHDGWLSTGDAGAIDDDGHIIIYDRLKDMMALKDGTTYSATYIENRVKFDPHVKDCLVVGGAERDYLFAIIIIDFTNVGRWAEKKRIPYTTFSDLCQKIEVYELILKSLQSINKTIPTTPLKTFVNLYKEFDADEGELTRSGKVKRSFLYSKYDYLIESVYAGKEVVPMETEIVYHDGRKGTISADLRVQVI
jgi:long-chain acyl-CoA synthetase